MKRAIWRNLFTLYKYYHAKKQGYTLDWIVDKWEGATIEDFDHIRSSVYIHRFNKEAIYRLRDAEDWYEKVLIKAVLDFEGFADEVPIRLCTFMQFLNIYGEFCLNIIKETERRNENGRDQ